MSMPPLASQLSLHLHLPDRARFGNFLAGPNAEAVAQLQAFATGSGSGAFFLVGPRGSGKTHLLLAALREARAAGRQPLYLSLADPALSGPAVLQEMLTGVGFLLLDDLDCVAGDRQWEEALFALYNGMHDGRGRLLMAAQASPDECGFVLKDLVSRLNWGLRFALKPLADADRIGVLQLRARGRGMDMPDEVAQYLIRRYPRDLGTLCRLLDELDVASLQAQRRLTIPFIKQVLEDWGAEAQ